MDENEDAILVVDRQKLLLIFEGLARTCMGLGNFGADATVPVFNCGTEFCPNRSHCNSLMGDIRRLLGDDEYLEAFDSGEIIRQKKVVGNWLPKTKMKR